MEQLLINVDTDSLIQQQHRILSKLNQRLPVLKRSNFGSLVHFQFSDTVPVQRWFQYREGYSTELVRTLIHNLGISRFVFDPFCGCGTTLLASRWSGLHAIGIDINPISVLVATVENCVYSENDIKEIEHALKRIEAIKQHHAHYFLPADFHLAKKTFAEENLSALLVIKDSIDKITDSKIHDFLKVAWLNIIEQISNIKKEGNGIKYKHRKRTPSGYVLIPRKEWENQHFPEDRFEYVKRVFSSHARLMVEDLKTCYGAIAQPPTIYEGSCLDIDKFIKEDIQY